MQNLKTKFQSLGFTSKHAQLLTVAVAVFSVLTFVKSGASIKAVFVNADAETTMLSYEDVRAEVMSEYGIINTALSPETDENQLALLDRGTIDGSVLGEAIGIGAIPDADQLLLPEITSQLNLSVSADDSSASQLAYQTQTQGIELDANIIGLLSDLNSDDTEVLRQSVKGWEWVIRELSLQPVPPSLEQYHKTKLTYYSVMMNIGKVYAGDKSDSDLQLLTKAMLSYSQKIESLRAELNQTLGLLL